MKTLKTLVIIFLGTALLMSCSKESKKPEAKDRAITVDEIPSIVKESINRDYPGAVMVEADEVTQPNATLTYDVELELKGKVFEVMYASDGKSLGVENDGDDDGEEDENDD